MPVQLQHFFNLQRNDAEQRYAMYRQLAYQDVTEKIQIGKRYKLDGIGHDALRAFESVWRSHHRKVAWDWVEIVQRLKRKAHARLELAIWHEGTLCGLMLGRTSRRKTRVYVSGIEGAPYQHPLKTFVIPIAVEVAEAYATVIGAKEVRIESPHPALVAKYEKFGYSYKPNFFGSYMCKYI